MNQPRRPPPRDDCSRQNPAVPLTDLLLSKSSRHERRSPDDRKGLRAAVAAPSPSQMGSTSGRRAAGRVAPLEKVSRVLRSVSVHQRSANSGGWPNGPGFGDYEARRPAPAKHLDRWDHGRNLRTATRSSSGKISRRGLCASVLTRCLSYQRWRRSPAPHDRRVWASVRGQPRRRAPGTSVRTRATCLSDASWSEAESDQRRRCGRV